MQEFWSRLAHTYGNALDLEERIRNAAAELVNNMLKKSLPAQPLEVIELGCGNGKILKKCEQSASPICHITGVDSSAEMLSVAKNFLTASPYLTLTEEDVLAYVRQAPKKSFDAVFSCNTLHNLPSTEDVATTISQMAEMLRPGGKILFDIRNDYNPFIRRGYRKNRAQGLQFFTFSWRRAVKILKKAGCSNIRVKPLSYATPEEAGKIGSSKLFRFFYRCYLYLTRSVWCAPYVLVEAEKKMPQFTSIIWGYHPQLFKLSPLENYHLEALKTASELGYQVGIYAIGSRAKIEDDPNLFAKFPISYHRGFFSYLSFLWSKRGSVFYCNTFTLLSFLPAWFSKKSVFMGHDSVLRKTWVKRIVQNFLLSRFAKIRVISQEEKEYLQSQGLLAEKIIVAPLAIDVDLFGSITADKRSGMVFLGNVTPDKDGLTILRALAQAHKKLPDLTLDIIGEVRDERFVPLMHELKLEQAVVFRGFIPHSELPKHLGRYQVYVNSSISEGQCLAVYEAAMAGLAVCLPRTMSFTGTFKDRALFHEIGDASALAHSMFVYATDSAMRDRHIESAQKYIREQYNRTVVNERVKKLFSFDIV